MRASGPFTARPTRDPGTIHVGDDGRQGGGELTGEVLDAGAVDRVSLAQVCGEVSVAELSGACLALSAERAGTSLAEIAALAAPELEQLWSSEFTAHHRRAYGRKLARAGERDTEGQALPHARVASCERSRDRGPALRH